MPKPATIASRAAFIALTPVAVFAFLITVGLGLDAAGLVDDMEASPERVRWFV